MGLNYYPAQAGGPAKAGWSLCVLTLERGLWTFAGLASGSISTEADNNAFGQTSFEPELIALARALAFCLGIPVPASIFYDSESAASGAWGEASGSSQLPARDICLTQMHLRCQASGLARLPV